MPKIFKQNNFALLGANILIILLWITNHQSEFSRLDMALVIKIGRLMDSGVGEIDHRLPV